MKITSAIKISMAALLLSLNTLIADSSFSEWLKKQKEQQKSFLKTDKSDKPEKPVTQQKPPEQPVSTQIQPEQPALEQNQPVKTSAQQAPPEQTDPKPEPPQQKPSEKPAPKQKPSTETKPGKSYDISPFYDYIKQTILWVNGGRDPMESNYVSVVNNGYDALLLRLHLIRNARNSINIQTFIFVNDETGRLVMYELIEAAKRGVKVRIIADHFASERNREIVAFLATVHPNIEIKHYRPIADRLEPSSFQETLDNIIPNRTNQRMHNKVFVVDDLVAITGGRNIENSYYNFSTGMNFKDRDILLLGPIAMDMNSSFEEYWNYKYSVSSQSLEDIKKEIRKNSFARFTTREEFAIGNRFDQLCQLADNNEYVDLKFAKRLINAKSVVLLVDEPGKNRKFFWMRGKGRITKQLTEIIMTAKKSLVIQTPYLVLDKETRKLFAKMKKKNKELQIIVNSNSFSSTDNTMAYSANYRLRSAYIEDCGLEIYEYKPHPEDLLHVLPSYPELEKLAAEKGLEDKPFLCVHAKTFVLDDIHTFIGSYNLDPRSANLNTEVGLLINDPFIAAIVREDIFRDCRAGNSWVINRLEMPLGLDAVNGLIESTLRMTPLDIWPIRNTTCFDLVDGKEPLPPYHPDFYKNYREVGAFPGAPKGLSHKEIITKLFKTFGSAAQHLL